MSISFAVTAFNEMSEGRNQGRKLLKSLAWAQGRPAVGEIVVVNDGSSDWNELISLVLRTAKRGEGQCHSYSDTCLCWEPSPGRPGTWFYHNPENLGVFGNKLEAIARCGGDWVVNCDSDNTMDANYLDMVASLDKKPNTWYCPSFARPEFDYRGLVGRWDLASAQELLAMPLAECALNTGNQIVHRESFMKVFGGYRGRRFDLMLEENYLGLSMPERAEHKWRLVFDAKDSFIFNMLWLSSGGKLEIVPGLEYDHYYTSGPESNYARAPEEKDKLNDILVAELRQRSIDEQRNKVKRGEYE